MPVQPSATAPEAVPGQKTIIEEPTETAPDNGQTIKENPGAEKTQEAPQLQNLQKLLKQGLETKDIPLLRSILHNSKVAELPEWKSEGALGLIKKDQGIQAVYGPKADVLKSDINDIL